MASQRCRFTCRLGSTVCTAIVNQKNVDGLCPGLLQQRTDGTANHIRFISGRGNHSNPNGAFICVPVTGRRSSVMNAPETTTRKQEISPDQQAQDSGGKEHSRYCTHTSSLENVRR